MRLEKIHLGGFKSFADAVSVELKDQMIGIVGPNGCGKSNVVDAVRWVMGEASRHIRAMNLEDVIFSGTISRKPVEQAFVELIFDNAQGKCGVQYAQYGEISIRRTVSRDRDSKYYINGKRCRRKDIADIFFGTGLGANSYAIIEQGMISRIVEAKPDEMRSYVEEAAGVSKYKERRKETEIHIRHTRDNLDRVMDIREEIDKQLRKLKRQVREAKRYAQLKSKKDMLRAGLMLMRLRYYEAEQKNAKKVLSEKRMSFDQSEVSIQATEAKIERQRTDLEMANNKLHTVREALYRLDAKATALESEITSQEQDAERIRREQKEIEETLRDISSELRTERERYQKFEARVAELQIIRERLTDDTAANRENAEDSENELNKLYKMRDRHHSESRESSEKLKVEKARGELYRQSISEIDKSESEIDKQREEIDPFLLEAEKKENIHRLKHSRYEAEQSLQMLEQASADIKRLRGCVQALSGKLNEGQVQAQEAQGQISSLEVLQEAALGHDTESFYVWLEEAELSDKDLVSENIAVERGWEDAVELVLSAFLGGVRIDSLDRQAQNLDSFNQGNLVLIESSLSVASAGQETLADKVSSEIGLHDWLSRVLLAENITDAMTRRHSLSVGESIVTRDGAWVGKNWLQLRRFSQGDEGVLMRKTKIESLRRQLDELQESSDAVKRELNQAHIDLSAQEAVRDREQERRLAYLKEIATLESKITHCDEQIDQQCARSEKLDQMKAEIALRRERLIVEHRQSRREYEQAQAQVQEMNTRFDELAKNIMRQANKLAETKRLFHQTRDTLHQAEIENESARVNLAAAQKHIEQLQRQEASLKQHQTILLESMNHLTAPLSDSQRQHGQLLKEHLDSDEKLAGANRNVSAKQAKIGELESERNRLREQFDARRKANEDAHAALQVSVARYHDAKAAFDKFAVDIVEVEASLRADVTVQAQEAALQEVQEKLGRLGAINLVALGEFNELSERKTFIDLQYKDLTSALSNLEAVIKKIDHETRSRFKKTFERINENLRKLFPALFGGGEAYLEMTESDLLNTGITVMAKPPGKRLSTIQLMSGGEKALAAAAVVFSIFELNPAPFCLLDEVDAPLDEHNIERFCSMIKDMSRRIQFVMITHSKLTMEYMDSLIGITMYEAGVSRLVSVDMDEALKMASA